MAIGIYIITNIITQEVYIGKTSCDFNVRWRNHINNLKNNTHHNSKLQESWNTYGETSFKFEIIKICEEVCLADREIFWIKKLNSYKNGFNKMINKSPGMSGKKHSTKTKQKMRNRALAMSSETKRKISISMTGNTNAKGVTFTKERRNKISKTRMRSKNKNARSKYYGVSSHPSGKWMARFTINGRQIYLGLFSTETDAAIAYNEYIRKENVDRPLNTI